MDPDQVAELLEAVRLIVARTVHDTVTFGVVTATSPLQVRFNTDTTATQIDLRAAGYTPTVGDEVVLHRVGRDWICAYAYEGVT